MIQTSHGFSIIESVFAPAEMNRLLAGLSSASGGVVAMCPLTVHASSKAVDDQPRRVLHVEYAATLNLAAGIELAVA